jgi:hypothetical protein
LQTVHGLEDRIDQAIHDALIIVVVIVVPVPVVVATVAIAVATVAVATVPVAVATVPVPRRRGAAGPVPAGYAVCTLATDPTATILAAAPAVAIGRAGALAGCGALLAGRTTAARRTATIATALLARATRHALAFTLSTADLSA